MSLQGTLRTLGIAEVLEFLSGRKATGRLEITSDSGYATYWVSGGEIASVDYAFTRESGTDAAEATYYALAELDGSFHFDEDQRPEDVEETESIADVLSRTADSADGWSYVEEVISSPQHWLTRSETLDEPVTVQPEWWKAVAAVDSGTTSQRLAHALEMRALAASTMASEMVRAGLLEVGDPRTEPESEPAIVEDIAEEVLDEADAAGEPEASPSETTIEAGEPEIVAEADAMAAVESDEHHGLHLFGGSTSESAPADADEDGDDTRWTTERSEHLSVVEAMEAPLAETIEPAPAPPGDDAGWEDEGTTPVSPALVWDAEAPAADQPMAPGFAEPAAPDFTEAVAPDFTEAAAPDFTEPAPAPFAGETVAASTPEAEQDQDWDDDDGWATDHSQPAAVTPGGAEEFVSAPVAADVFGSAPAVDASMAPPPPQTDSAEPNSDEYASDDRSSVLKFLRRD